MHRAFATLRMFLLQTTPVNGARSREPSRPRLRSDSRRSTQLANLRATEGVRMRPAVVAAIVAILLGTTFLVPSSPVVRAVSAVYSSHAPIVIDGDGAFSTPGNGVISGRGTAKDPYVISGWDINASASDGIAIRNTTAYFVIRQSYIHGGGFYTNYYRGIAFSNVAHGSVEDATVSQTYAGLWLDSSSDIAVSTSQLGPDTGLGVSATSSSNVRVSSSNLSDDDFGISAYNIVGIAVTNNTFSRNRYGLFCYECSDVGVNENTFAAHYSSIEITAGGLNVSVSNNTVLASNQWGLRFDYLVNVTVSGNTIGGSGDAGVYTFSDTDVTFRDNNFSSNGNQGIRLYQDSRVVLERNLVEGNALGIEIGGVFNGTVRQNRIARNAHEGVLIYNSLDVAFRGNQIEMNGGNGIGMFWDEHLIISSNTFIDDGVYLQGDLSQQDSLEHFNSHVISADNLVNGRPLAYYKDCNGATVDGASVGQLIVVNCTNVRIANLTVTDANLGIQTDFVDGLTITASTVSGNDFAGVWIWKASNVTVARSNVSFNAAGIALTAVDHVDLVENVLESNGYGIEVSLCQNVGLWTNEVVDSHWAGIAIDGSPYLHAEGNRVLRSVYDGIDIGSPDGEFTGNQVAGNGANGIFLYSGPRVKIWGNWIESNAYGVSVFYGNSNRIYHNDFVNNSIQATVSSANSLAWDDGYPSGGNYWSDYAGVDRCSGPNQDICPSPDSIGDTPYVVGSGSQDGYPLMQPFETNTPPLASFNVTPAMTGGNGTFIVDASTSTDRQDASGQLAVRWDWESDGVWDTNWSTDKIASHSYGREGNFAILLAVRDTGGLVAEETRPVIVDSTAPVTVANLSGTLGEHTWFVSPVFVTLMATDDRSGVAEILYRVDRGSWRSYTGRIPIDEQGSHTLDYFARDEAGNEEPVHNLTVWVDTRPPTTQIDVAGTAGLAGWYVSPVNVTLNASDATSGLASIEYQVDGGSWQPYSSVIRFGDGDYNLSVRSIDHAGNVDLSTRSIRVDTVPPATTLLVDGVPPALGARYPDGAVVTLSGADAGSGIAATFYRIDAGNWLTYAGSIPYSGSHTLEYYSVDRAGNAEAIRSTVLWVGGVPPTTSVTLEGTAGANGWYTSDVRIQLDTTGAGTTIAYRVDGSAWAAYAGPFTLSDGEHSIQFQATDSTGLSEPLRYLAVRVDTSPPVITALSVPTTSVDSRVEVAWSASDATSGLMRFDLRVDAGSWQSVGLATIVTLTLADGVHEIRVRALDFAGNFREASARVNVDTSVFSFDGPVHGLPTLLLVGVGVAVGLLVARSRRRSRRRPPANP